MSQFVKQLFPQLEVVVDKLALRNIQKIIIKFETNPNHALVLNSQSIGVKPISFMPNDRKAFFEALGTDEDIVKEMIDRIPGLDIEKESINTDHKVASDPMNLLSVWAIYLIHHSRNLNKNEKELFKFAVAKILNYKFLTSYTHRSFQYDADPDIMLAAVNSLSRKFDIVTLGTWRAVIEDRAAEFIRPGGLHYKTLISMDNDKDIAYAVTDSQTRIRDRVKNVARVYYAMYHAGEAIGNYSSVREVDGVKMLTDNVSLFDSMISNMTREVLDEHQFYDKDASILVTNMFTAIEKNDMLRSVIRAFSELASEQYRSGDFDLVKKVGREEIIVGVRALMTNIIQKTYRKLIFDDVKLRPENIVYATKNIYSSSRISDPELLQIKNSIVYFLDSIKTSQRDATRASLRIALIVYIMIKTFRYL